MKEKSRTQYILNELEDGPIKLEQILSKLFPNNLMKVIGLIIVESHLNKLEIENKIKRENDFIKKT